MLGLKIILGTFSRFPCAVTLKPDKVNEKNTRDIKGIVTNLFIGTRPIMFEV